jgi:glycosyltransferase involved in cell wall biosynthesis
MKKKIAIFQYDLNVGGIQKSLLNLLNNIDVDKYQIDLFLFSNVNFFEKEIPSSINIKKVKPLGLIEKRLPFNFLLKVKRNIYSEEIYDLAIDFDSYQNDTALGALKVNAKKRCIWIHNDASEKYKEEFKYRVIHKLAKSKYKFFDLFIGVSKGAIPSFKKLNKLDEKEYLVIPNFIDAKEIIAKSKEKIDIKVDKNKYNFVSVGRICHPKGFDILLFKLKELIKYRNDFHFYLIGDGPDRKKIETIIKKENLLSYVTLLGNQKNPFKYLNNFDGFCLTSRYEGQGMVILEAKVLGLEIFISKNLEKYNEGIKGYNNIVDGMKIAKKRTKKIDNLIDYNKNIKNSLEELFEGKK